MEKRPDIRWFGVLDSTNSELRRRLEGLDNLSVVAARRQTAGRGQGDHTWTSSPGRNLTFSILLRFPSLPASDILVITCIITLAIRDLLLDEGVEARIKWPNDIWVGDRKICGILIENIMDGDSVARSIVGVGLNLNQTSWPEDIPNPVSLKLLTGKVYSSKRVLRRLHEKISLRYAMSGEDGGRKALEEEFRRYMFTLPA